VKAIYSAILDNNASIVGMQLEGMVGWRWTAMRAFQGGMV
jgi:hypothetical protein